MYQVLLHIHSVLRWMVLLLLILSVIMALVNRGKEIFTSEKRVNMYSMMFTHFQLLFGLILYFISPKVIFSTAALKSDLTRFFLAEHSIIMIIAIALITIGYSKSKKAGSNMKARRIILLFYALGLILMLAGIPWPFRGFGANLF